MHRGDGWIFILNPVAGRHLSKGSNYSVSDRIKTYFPEALISTTADKGDATRIAQQAIEKAYTHIIAVGGDGTVHEIVQALAKNPGPTLGVIPCGTGNDYSSLLGQNTILDDSFWSSLNNATQRPVDIGRCNDIYFANGMGIGFDAQVAVEVNQPSFMRGKAMYWKVILKNLLFYRSQNMNMSRGAVYTQCRNFLITIAVGRRFGGGFTLTPRAWADDGLLDVCMVRNIPVWKRIYSLLKLQKGEHMEEPEVQYSQVEDLSLAFDRIVPAHLDGQVYYYQKYDIKVLKKHINVIYYPDGKHYFLNEGA